MLPITLKNFTKQFSLSKLQCTSETTMYFPNFKTIKVIKLTDNIADVS